MTDSLIHDDARKDQIPSLYGCLTQSVVVAMGDVEKVWFVRERDYVVLGIDF